MFFSVDEKLKEDEEFEIHTSTMVLGIRGTSGYVSSGRMRTALSAQME